MSSPAAQAEADGSPPGDVRQARSEQDAGVVLEFHYKPVANLQIAIWLEDAEGNFLEDVFVTQATGKLGIGNRSGRWDFLSSWRAPYGPRPMVLPVWAHRRGRTYPKVVFFDEDPADQDSLGWHESTSSPEPYFCRPLRPDEHETISTDTMTCPSPSSFQTDKGRFHKSDISFYPPRNDLVSFEDDSEDAREFAAINDLDSVSGATPVGDQAATQTFKLESIPQGPLVAWIEMSLEHDENEAYQFEREDHFIDPRLSGYGVEYFGQPSVVYRVEFDPRARGFTSTSEYAGYGEWDGTSGTLYPPDDTISTSDGSGADRLQAYELGGRDFRFGVFSHGLGDDGGDGWDACSLRNLPPMVDLRLEPLDFDTVEIQFLVPSMDAPVDLEKTRVYYLKGDTPITEENLGQAVEAMCGMQPEPGEPGSCLVGELHGNATYQFAVRYEDTCSNISAITTAEVQTPRQQFTQIDSFCFIATAAYGGQWLAEVGALRSFRDVYLEPSPIGLAFVHFYYAYSPMLARLIEDSPIARPAVRLFLQPLADLARLSTASLARR